MNLHQAMGVPMTSPSPAKKRLEELDECRDQGVTNLYGRGIDILRKSAFAGMHQSEREAYLKKHAGNPRRRII